MAYRLNWSDGDYLYHPNHTDLISNLSLFNQAYDSKRLSDLEDDFSDNSDYTTYCTLESVLDEYDPDTYEGKTFVVRVDEKYIFSSDSERGGYDRPQWLLRKSNDDKCRENLRAPISGTARGWNEPDANILNGWMRIDEIIDGDINTALGVSEKKYEFTLVKNMGNNRFWMKKIANKGGRSEYLIKILFHKISTEVNPISTADYIRIEASGHNQDADARASQNEQQKLVSSYRSATVEVVDCIKFLKENKVEYHIDKNGNGLMAMEGFYNPKEETWPIIHSIQGLKDGLNNGMFKKYGSDNVKAALGTCRNITKITGEDGFSYSALTILSLMYKSLTDDHTRPGDDRKAPRIFDRPQLLLFFEELYKMRNSPGNTAFGTPKFSQLADLSQSQGMKSWPYIASVAFWPDIQNWYKAKVNTGNGEQAFSDGHPSMQYFINQADLFVKGEVKKNVS